MLELQNLSVYYPVDGQEFPALANCSFQLAKGDCVGIIGESGSGKTTLAKAILGIAPGRVTGKVLLNGVELVALGEEERRRLRGARLSLSFPNSLDFFHPMQPVRRQVAEVLTEHGMADPTAALAAADEALVNLGLPLSRCGALPHRLSGGERQRVLLAMAFVGHPETVILDEPTMGLDILEGRALLAELGEKLRGRTSLIISHDIAVVRKLCDRVAVLYAGRLCEIGPTEEVLDNPRHPYSRALVSAVPGATSLRDLLEIRGDSPNLTRRPSGCPFHPRCTQMLPSCREQTPALTPSGDRQLACHRGGIIELLRVRGLYYSYPGNGGKAAQGLEAVDLTLRSGDFQVLVGETGSGKTTLAKLLCGLLPAGKGTISLNDGNDGSGSCGLHSSVQMVFQDPRTSVSPRLTVREIVREPLDIKKIGTPEEREEWGRKALRDAGLSPDPALLSAYPRQLSSGEVQRAVIARALIQNPRILVADEPTAMLDPSLSARVLKLFLRIQQSRGLTVLMVTHDLALARRVASHLLVMFQGRLVEGGAARDVFLEPWHPYTKSLLGLGNENPQSVRNKEGLGCPFRPRCPRRKDPCSGAIPGEFGTERHWVRCHDFSGPQVRP